MENEWVNGRVELLIGGEPLELKFTVPAKPVKLRQMLPVFQQMSNRFNEIAAENVKAQGKEISCKAGCGGRIPRPDACRRRWAIGFSSIRC